MAKIGVTRWNRYKNIINQAHEDFNQEVLSWFRHVPTGVTLFNEGIQDNYTEISLKVLMGYNSYRTWPITKHDGDSGELDNQNLIVFMNLEYLRKEGFLNSEGYFNFNPANDYFQIKGIRYKGEGDTDLSQAYDEPLMFGLVLRREEEVTGKSRY